MLKITIYNDDVSRYFVFPRAVTIIKQELQQMQEEIEHANNMRYTSVPIQRDQSSGW
jgi:hypothetical protein